MKTRYYLLLLGLACAVFVPDWCLDPPDDPYVIAMLIMGMVSGAGMLLLGIYGYCRFRKVDA